MMTSQKHIFRATSAPTHKELHSLWATLTNKQCENKHGVDFKIVANGRLVQVTCAEPLTLQEVILPSNTFAFLRSEQVEATAYEAGQTVNLQGELAYSVHGTKTGRDECPVDAFGRLKPHLQQAFLGYMTAQTGVDFEQALEAGALELAWENRSEPAAKVWLNDVITFNATARVLDEAVLNRLPLRALGRRRSYGLGNTHVAKVSTNPAPEPANEQEAL